MYTCIWSHLCNVISSFVALIVTYRFINKYKQTHTCLYMLCVCVCMCVYIYIVSRRKESQRGYIERERETEREREKEIEIGLEIENTPAIKKDRDCHQHPASA